MKNQNEFHERQSRRNLAGHLLGVTLNSALAGFFACSTFDSFCTGDYSSSALYLLL